MEAAGSAQEGLLVEMEGPGRRESSTKAAGPVRPRLRTKGGGPRLVKSKAKTWELERARPQSR